MAFKFDELAKLSLGKFSFMKFVTPIASTSLVWSHCLFIFCGARKCSGNFTLEFASHKI